MIPFQFEYLNWLWLPDLCDFRPLLRAVSWTTRLLEKNLPGRVGLIHRPQDRPWIERFNSTPVFRLLAAKTLAEPGSTLAASRKNLPHLGLGSSWQNRANPHALSTRRTVCDGSLEPLRLFSEQIVENII